MWVGQYPEIENIVSKEKNQSMSLDEKTLKGEWAKSLKTDTEFFIINEAIIKNLCILGDDVEPCFEGAKIVPMEKPSSFSYNDKLFQQFFNLMSTEIQKTYIEGGKSMKINKYTLDKASKVYKILIDGIKEKHFSEVSFTVKGLFTNEESNNTFAVIEDAEKENIYSINFSVTEDESVEVLDKETLSAIEEFDFSEDDDDFIEHIVVEGEATIYTAEQYNELEVALNASVEENATLTKSIEDYVSQLETANNTIAELTEKVENFVSAKETEEKENVLNSFTLLAEQDKEELRKNINNYTVEEISTQLSIIYTQKSLEKAQEEDSNVFTFNLDTLHSTDDEEIDAWVKEVVATQKEI